MSIRVLVADDHALIRAGFCRLLDAEPDLTVVGEAGDGEAAVRAVRDMRPDVALLDIRMPVLNGIEATRRITDTGNTRVVILTLFDLDEYVYAALRAGASGFLLKDAPPEQLLDAVRAAAARDALIAPSVTRRLLDEFARLGAAPETAPALATLTGREREVLAHMARGLSNAEIAASMYLGETTVKTHVGRILGKLGARDRVQAVVTAYEGGLVRPGVPWDGAPTPSRFAAPDG